MVKVMIKPNSMMIGTGPVDELTPIGSSPVAPVKRAPGIILTLSARRLEDVDWRSRSDPFCTVSLIGGYGGTEVLGRTEIIHSCLDPAWTKKFHVPYKFEQNQQLNFEIRDYDHDHQKFLGSITIPLAEILNAPANRLTRNIHDENHRILKSELIVCAEQQSEGRQVAMYFACSATNLDKKDFMDKSDPFIQVQRINQDGSFHLAHRTRWVAQNLNPKWRPFEIELGQLCYGDKNKQFLIECLDHDDNGRHDLIGTCKTTVERVITKKDATLPLINEKKKAKKNKKYVDSGKLHFDNAFLWHDYTFLDYIQNGTELDFTIAIDFTRSNGPINDTSSLHYLSDHVPNQYQIALRALGEILQYYCRTQTFNAYGFGAKLPGDAEHNFTTGDPTVQGIDGLLAAYIEAVGAVTLSAPANFLPVIRKAAHRAFDFQKRGDNHKYEVLVILSNGIINDMTPTKDEIVKAAVLPLSIIMVGLGYETFTKMKELDSDKKFLTNSKGAAARRDIVQFVEMRRFLPAHKVNRPDEYDQCKAQLAKEVLAEVPKQLTEYMKSKGIPPQPSPNVDERLPREGSIRRRLPELPPSESDYPQMEQMRL